MNNYMMIATVPMGYADKLIKAAKEAGAPGATTLRARGADHSAGEGLFSLRIEQEEEMVLIVAEEDITNAICAKIHDEFDKNSKRSGSIYILPVEA